MQSDSQVPRDPTVFCVYILHRQGYYNGGCLSDCDPSHGSNTAQLIPPHFYRWLGHLNYAFMSLGNQRAGFPKPVPVCTSVAIGLSDTPVPC